MALSIEIAPKVPARYDGTRAWHWVVKDTITKRVLWGPGTHLGAEKYVNNKVRWR